MQGIPIPQGVNEVGAGVITVNNWTMAPDGETYLYFFAERWIVVTDDSMPVDKFRSSERWQLWALNHDGSFAKAVFPGCQVKAWMRCERPPNRPTIYDFTGKTRIAT